MHFPADYNNIHYRLSPREYEKLYNQEVRKMVEYGGFDVLGHADMPKKYHLDYRPDVDFLTETMRLCVTNGIVPEMNTSALRQIQYGEHTLESMISVDLAHIYAKLGGKFVTISSDSHNYQTIGSHFGETYQGICDTLSLCYFEKGKLVKLD